MISAMTAEQPKPPSTDQQVQKEYQESLERYKPIYQKHYALFLQAIRESKSEDVFIPLFEKLIEFFQQLQPKDISEGFWKAVALCFFNELVTLSKSETSPDKHTLPLNEYLVHFYHGVIHLSLKNPEKALPCFVRSCELMEKGRGKAVEPQFMDYLDFCFIGNNNEKEYNLQATYVLRPKNADIYYYLGMVKRELNRAGFNEDLAHAFCLRGANLSLFNEHHAALNAFNKAIELNSLASDYYYRRGISHWAAGNRQSALSDYQIAIDKCSNPKRRFTIRRKLAEAHYEMGEFQQALSLMTRLSEQKSEIVVTINEQGLRKLDPNAIMLIEELFFISHFMGKVYHELGERELSLASYESALKMQVGTLECEWMTLAPRIAVGSYENAQYYIERQEFQKALHCYRLVIVAYKKAVVAISHRLIAQPLKKITPRYHIELFVAHVVLLQSLPKKEINLDRYRNDALELIEEIKKRAENFDVDIADFLKKAHSILEEGIDFCVDKQWLDREIAEHEKQAKIYNAERSHPPDRPFKEFMKILEEQKGFFSVIFDWPEVDKIQQTAILNSHHAFLKYLIVRHEIVRLYAMKSQQAKSIGHKGNAFKSLVAAVTVLNSVREEMEQYRRTVVDAQEVKDIVQLKLSDLKVMEYKIISEQITQYLNQSDFHRDCGHYTDARKSLEMAEACVEALDKIEIGKDIGGRLERMAVLQRMHVDARPLDILRRIKENRSYIDKKLQADEVGRCKRKLAEYENDPLVLCYGKLGNTTAVPFPSQLIEGAVKKQRTAAMRQTVNLSAHRVGLLYSEGPYDPQRKSAKVFGALAINFNEEIMAAHGARQTAGKEWKNYCDSITARVWRGTQLCHRFEHKQQNKDAIPIGFFHKAVVKEFDPKAHLHSEQAFYESLNALDIEKFIFDFRTANPSFKEGCKVYLVTFDMASELASCSTCKTSAIDMQNGLQNEGSFLFKLQKYLTAHGYVLAGNKHQQPGLKTVTRILAAKPYLDERHANPASKNAKYLHNMGIFEMVSPTVFASGTEAKLEQPGKQEKTAFTMPR